MNTETVKSVAPQHELDQIRSLTLKMREHERQVVMYGKQRRAILRRMRENNVPFRVLAETTGLTEQAIYKDCRWGK